MWIQTRPASASISLKDHAPTDRPVAARETVSFKLLPAARAALDLDTGEAFEGGGRIDNQEKQRIDVSITIHPTPDTSYYQHNHMLYADTNENYPFLSSIFIDVFIAETVFRELVSNLKCGILPTTITIGFGANSYPSFFSDPEKPLEQKPLEYGGPDGSRTIWHNKENLRVPIESVSFDYEIVKSRYEVVTSRSDPKKTTGRLMPIDLDTTSDRISKQIEFVHTVLAAMLKYARLTTTWIMVILAIMIYLVFLAKERIHF